MNSTHPPIPSDVDLRGLEYMPLLGNHLFGSEFNAMASDSAWRAALTLWWKAWNQVPAGSLPNDDTALCRLADLGRDVKGWRKLKEHALHGFVLCSDGRLYHPFLCEQALVAWDKRIKERERKAKWRAERDAKHASRNADVPRDKIGTETGTEQSQNADVPADGTRRDGTGRDDVVNTHREFSTDVGRVCTPAGSVCLAMKGQGIFDVSPDNLDLRKLIESGAEVHEFVAAAQSAVSKGKGFAYALGIVRRSREDAANAKPLHQGAMPTPQGKAPTAAELRVFRSSPQLMDPAARARCEAFTNAGHAAPEPLNVIDMETPNGLAIRMD